MYSKLKFELHTSTQNGIATLNTLFAEAGSGFRNRYDATNALKKKQMDKVAHAVETAIIKKEITAKDIMRGKLHLFIAVHPYDKSSDVDNYSIISKWVTDALEGIRIEIKEDGTLKYLGYYDSHSKKINRAGLPGQPFLNNDNFNNIIDIHAFYAGKYKRKPYIDFVWTSDWDEYDHLLMTMSKLSNALTTKETAESQRKRAEYLAKKF